VITPQYISLTPSSDDRKPTDIPDVLERGLNFEAAMAELGRELVAEAVRRANGDETAAATALGLTRADVQARLEGATPAAAGR